MTDRDAWEWAMLADPSVCLVAADWYEEHDDPEFAAALRTDGPAIIRFAAEIRLPPREAWESARRMAGAVTGYVEAMGRAAARMGEAFRAMAAAMAEAGRARAVRECPPPMGG